MSGRTRWWQGAAITVGASALNMGISKWYGAAKEYQSTGEYTKGVIRNTIAGNFYMLEGLTQVAHIPERHDELHGLKLKMAPAFGSLADLKMAQGYFEKSEMMKASQYGLLGGGNLLELTPYHNLRQFSLGLGLTLQVANNILPIAEVARTKEFDYEEIEMRIGNI